MNEHISVLAQRSLDLLDIKEDGIYVDGTLGRGGHASLIAEKLTGGQLYCFDLDLQAIEESKERLKNFKNITYIHDNFKNMGKYVDKVDGILLDLGVSSPQFDQAQRGFSYRLDGPLDMRMDSQAKLSAYDVVNYYSYEKLEKILWDYGQERNAKRIAKSIVDSRPIETTFALVEAIKKALPAKALNKKGHPAKQTFQALRIEVNDELNSLSQFLDCFPNLLNDRGRVVIITFHSLEDKMVKYCFKRMTTVEDNKRIALLPEQVKKADYRLLNHGDKPSEKEIEANRRAKSAIVRGIEKWQG